MERTCRLPHDGRPSFGPPSTRPARVRTVGAGPHRPGAAVPLGSRITRPATRDRPPTHAGRSRAGPHGPNMPMTTRRATTLLISSPAYRDRPNPAAGRSGTRHGPDMLMAARRATNLRASVHTGTDLNPHGPVGRPAPYGPDMPMAARRATPSGLRPHDRLAVKAVGAVPRPARPPSADAPGSRSRAHRNGFVSM